MTPAVGMTTAVAQHLSTLEEVGIIEVVGKGTTRLPTLHTAPIEDPLDGWRSAFEEAP